MKPKHEIFTKNDQKKFPVTVMMRRCAAKAVKAALEYEEFEDSAEVSITFTDNEGIRELNRDYRNIDSATDVLSFPMFDEEAMPDGRVNLGDIVISLERAQSQAEQYGHSFERELAFLAVHSTLHLLGYDHETSEEAEKDMFDRQREIMKLLGLER